MSYIKILKLLASIFLFVQLFPARSQELSLPYRSAGWTDREAAAHVLNRLAYGPQPGQVQNIEGDLENWVRDQLKAAHGTKALEKQLHSAYRALSLDLEAIGQTYPAPGVRLIFMMRQRGQYVDRRGRGRAGRGNMQGERGAMMGSDSSRGNGQQDLLQRILNAE